MTLVLAAAALLAPRAEAQATGAEETAAARALFRDGNRMLRQERWAEAADRFERALQLRQSPQIVYNLTTALIEIGQLVRATELLRSLENDESTPNRVQRAAVERREAIEPRIGELTVRVTGDRDGVGLELDGEPLAWAMVDVAVPADPGEHRVIALRDGETLADEAVRVPESDRAEVTLQLPVVPPTPTETANAAEPEPEPMPPPPERKSRWWIGLIVGVAAVGVAVGLGVGLTRERDAEPIQGTGGVLEIGSGS